MCEMRDKDPPRRANPHVAHAGALDCSHCGAVLSLETLAPEIICPYCGERNVLPPERLNALEQYRSDVSWNYYRAEHSAQAGAQWTRWYGGTTRQKVLRNSILVSAVLMPMLFTGIGALIGSAFFPDDSRAIQTAAGWVGAVAMFVVFGWGLTRFRAPSTAVTPVKVAVVCPNCGASSAIAAGEVVDLCLTCGASLVPTPEVMANALSAAETAARNAQFEQHRQEREGMLAVLRTSRSGFVAYYIFGIFATMLTLCAGGFSLAMMIGSEPYNPIIYLLWVLDTLLFVGFWSYLSQRREKKRRWQAAMQEVAARFKGTVGGLEFAVDWLNRFWPEAYDLAFLYAGNSYCAAAGRVDGLPVLVVVNPTPLSDESPIFAHALVSRPKLVQRPRAATGSSLPPAAAPHAQHIARLGFELSMFPSGVIAKANSKQTKILCGSPKQAEVLGEIALHAARLAYEVGQ